MEGAIAEQPFKSFQDLKRFKKKSQENRAFIDELCRGITVNTSYSSNIQVRYTGPHPKCRHVFMEFIVIRIKKNPFFKVFVCPQAARCLSGTHFEFIKRTKGYIFSSVIGIIYCLSEA